MTSDNAGSNGRKPIPDKFKGGRLLNAIRYNPNIKGIDKLILYDITAFCDLGENATFQEWVYRKKEDMEITCGIRVQAINIHIKTLISDGYILERTGKKNDGRNGAKWFRLTSKIFDEYLDISAPTKSYPLDGEPLRNRIPLAPTNSYPLAPTNSYPKHNNYEHNENEHNDLFSENPEPGGQNELRGAGSPNPSKNGEDKFFEKNRKKEEKESLEIGIIIIESSIDKPNFVQSLKKENAAVSKTLYEKYGIEMMIKLKAYFLDNNLLKFKCDAGVIINFIENNLTPEAERRKSQEEERIKLENEERRKRNDELAQKHEGKKSLDDIPF